MDGRLGNRRERRARTAGASLKILRAVRPGGGHLLMTMTMVAAMTDDAELLRRYASDRAEDAFAELVRRYLDLVYSAALRQVGGNPASAADVAQTVFTELARHAGRLARHPALTGWLYTTTHRMAARHVRGEVRRQRREQEAHVTQKLQRDTGPELDWARLRPVLDDAMHDLGETDRTAVLLRHFEQRPLAEVGSKLGLSENAARMRVDRALDKLRAKLAKRGVTSTASALAVALTGQAVTAAPTALVTSISAAALTAAAATASHFGLLSLMTSTQLKTAGAALLIAAAGTTIALQQLSARRLRAENVELRQRADTAAEDARLARGTAAGTADAAARQQPLSAELLRLRGEVGQLRQQLAGARRAEAAARKLGPAPSGPTEAEAEEATKVFAIRRMDAVKLLVSGLHMFAADHDGRFPDSLEGIVHELASSEELPEVAVEALRVFGPENTRPDDFEMMFNGLLKDIRNPSSAIVLREREAWQNSKGGWMRTYGFADGHSEIHRSDSGDYSAWEAEHQVRPKTGDPASGPGN